MRQVQEEACELGVAISHYIRNPSAENVIALIEAVADADIMLEQIKYILDAPVNIHIQKEQKLLRLKKLLGGTGVPSAMGVPSVMKE